ncbi:hypothetical protein B5S28_g4655 [[Candida] boidinii]|uniref:Unnamed protein product n=1 Tax=Candida boidinii TaxID=5477 RepID=A0ACB5TQI5_CANBO|nr:hypothetical protein B5S28_g4655 [[Candida] boidinii]OWB63177.1 hypothetical protein B5S29_g4137 [[Candida] boidinii]OWB75082.1 hypothetical protein B5S31_g4935 [[Candida] boidinii]OWB79127.1 hypothetical protein B5S32_g3340 [[Candida] boidinii]GME92859.1 unnamed protein product [[Candida] boidinii]
MAKKDASQKQASQATTTTTTATSTQTEKSSISASDKLSKKSLFTDLSNSIKTSYNSYLRDVKDDQKLILIDVFLTFLVILGIVQFVFCVIFGNFPFNAFLGGFISTVGQFVFTVALRLQSTDTKGEIFGDLSPERAFGDFTFASLILHFVVYHFIN